MYEVWDSNGSLGGQAVYNPLRAAALTVYAYHVASPRSYFDPAVPLNL